MDANFADLDKRAVTPFLLIPNRHDQMLIQQNILTVIKQLKEIYPERQFKLGHYGDIFDKITDDQDHFNTVHGELHDGKYMRVHKT
ncbi:hypothetical protein ABNN70_05720 [Sporolactobacillus sp. Y61]|uniref:Uncharacterized protein n=1 Tax=Sporolactobacillus sp. Y61 TaxID=3160863 RepID=A0AAU8IJ28_9BACL